jgi:hypothetical protein
VKLGAPLTDLTKKGFLLVHRGVTTDILEDEGGYEHMPRSSHSGLLAVVRLGVRRIKGGNWSNVDAGRPSHCVCEEKYQRVKVTLPHLRQGNAINYACLNQI